MIVRGRPSALGLFFVVRGSLIREVWPQVVGVALLSALVVQAHRSVPALVPGVNTAPFALLGIAISIFLSFRNSASYDRWWEGRKLWGQIIQTARDIARQSSMIEGQPERRALLLAVVAFARRAERQLRAAPGPESADQALAEAARQIGAAERAGALTPMEALVLHQSLVRLSQSLVGCERLANTPLPFAYTLLLHRTAYLFCFVLPFGFADTIGWGTPLMTALVAYTFFGLDALGAELEDPFALLPNGLPLAAYATTVEIALRQALGETDLPAPAKPMGFILT